MFPSLIDMIDNALGVITGPLVGELPTQRQVAQLIADGVTVASIASAAGVAVDVIERIMEANDAQP